MCWPCPGCLGQSCTTDPFLLRGIRGRILVFLLGCCASSSTDSQGGNGGCVLIPVSFGVDNTPLHGLDVRHDLSVRVKESSLGIAPECVDNSGIM